MKRIAHIFAIAFLMVAMLGQSAGASPSDTAGMDCCDPEMMQEMQGMQNHDADDCMTDTQCPGGDACCAQAVHSAPGLMPSVPAASAFLISANPVEMEKFQQPIGAPSAPFAVPPIA